MRKILIGIISGVIIGVMVGTTFVAPSLQKARLAPPDAIPNSETLPIANAAQKIDETNAAPTSPSRATPQTHNAVRLRIVSLFSPELPVLGEMALRLEQGLAATSGGAIDAQIFAAGALVPTTDTFDAVTSETVEAVFTTPGQWAPDSPALQLFTAIPFGPQADELLAWFYHGGGRDLFEDLFQRRGVHAVLCGAIPPEGSGWYREPIHKPDDFKGLNIRAFGLSANVLKKMGANIFDMDADTILAALEDHRLDGAEYSLPVVDAQMGFNRFARHYYFPGWQRPVTLFALAINEDVWSSLSQNARLAVEQTCGDNVRFALTRADALQFDALKDLGLAGVHIRRWPDPVLGALQSAWKETRHELSQQDSDFANIWNSLQKFRRDYAIWRDLSRP
ncbi:MAG: TRAP transporter substrate-binding protein [Rhodospirillales bacterium]|nr:TRAP transporter substrate-binding protein [Rhodospirillales bacterium]